MKTAICLLLAAVAFTGCTSRPAANVDAPQVVAKAGVSEISPQEAKAGTEAAYAQFIDVRTREEYAGGHAARTRNIPLDELPNQLGSLERNEPVYLICRSGARSKKAADILVDNGFRQAISISGGTEAWQAAGLPMAQ
jgi:rhodanese-related sulfurtransferase